MTPRQLRSALADDYRKALDQIGLTQNAAARFLRIGERSSRRYALAENELPFPIEALLKIMAAKKIKPEQVLKLVRQRPTGARS